MMRHARIAPYMLLGISTLILAWSPPVMSTTQTPAYAVIAAHGNIEIRRYAPMIVAQVQVQGPRKEAINAGFRTLADYIFGNNALQAKVAMTAPVQQQPSDGGWAVSFVMPRAYTMDTLPRPNTPDIALEAVPETTWAVIRFSGTHSDENLGTHEAELRQHIESQGIGTTGPPKYAFYNPPWVLPWMRRNEIMMEVAAE